jgi:hypothetical protein
MLVSINLAMLPGDDRPARAETLVAEVTRAVLAARDGPAGQTPEVERIPAVPRRPAQSWKRLQEARRHARFITFRPAGLTGISDLYRIGGGYVSGMPVMRATNPVQVVAEPSGRPTGR